MFQPNNRLTLKYRSQLTSSPLRIEVTPEMNTSSQKSEQVFSNWADEKKMITILALTPGAPNTGTLYFYIQK